MPGYFWPKATKIVCYECNEYDVKIFVVRNFNTMQKPSLMPFWTDTKSIIIIFKTETKKSIIGQHVWYHLGILTLVLNTSGGIEMVMITNSVLGIFL